MPPNFSLRKNRCPFFLSRQEITGFIIFYRFLSVLFRKTSCPTPQQFSAFWFEILMYSFRENAEFIATYLSFFFNNKLLPPQMFVQMSIIKTLIFVEKAVCPSFFLSRKAHAVSFLLRRTSPYPVIVDATTYSNKVCIFSYDIRYAQSIHRNFVFFTFMGTFMPF